MLLSCTWPGHVWAGTDPWLEWHTLETPHFRIHYPEGLEALAQRTSVAAEDAHEVLTKQLGWQPAGPTEVVLSDFSDGANGFARVKPYNRISLLAHPPPATSALAHHGDYWRLLVFHEYAHVLHLDHTSGLPALANELFGRAVMPQQGLPVWFVEGLAVWAETQYTAQGRNHRAFFEMSLRTAALQGVLPTLAELTGTPKWPPRGEMLYAQGGAFVDWIVRQKGDAALRAFLKQYGSVILQYGVNTAARVAFGESLDALHRVFRDSVIREAHRWHQRRAKQGWRNGEPITELGENHSQLRISPCGGYLAYQRGTGRDPTELMVRNLNDQTEQSIAICWGGCSAPTWSPDSERIYYAKPTWHRTFFRYHDLFELDLESGLERQLTTAARAQAPFASPDGQSLVFTRTDGGKVDLVLRNLATGNERVLLNAGDEWRQPSDPQISPDGKWVAVSVSAGGTRDIWLISIESGEANPLMRDEALDLWPTFSPDGSTLLFAREDDSTFDIFAIDLHEEGTQRTLFRVTRTEGGALDPAVGSGALWYRHWSHRGWDLWRMPWEPGQWERVGPLGADGEAPNSPNIGGVDFERLPTPAAENWLPSAPYQALRTLAPQAWLPDLQATSAGVTASVELSATDAAELHRWYGRVEWTSSGGLPTVATGYQLDRFAPTLSADFFWYRTDDSAYADYTRFALARDVFTAGFTARMPFNDDWKSHALIARLDAIVSNPTGLPSFVLDPVTIPPRLPQSSQRFSAAITWRHNSARTFAWSISRERGRDLGITAACELPFAGSATAAWTFRWDYNEFVSLGHSHVLALRWEGGVSGSPNGIGRTFRLGGIPTRPLLEDILQRRGLGASLLRGYPAGFLSGDLLQLASVEWRFPLWYAHAGLGTLPIFLERLHAAVFTDLGTATVGGLEHGPWRVGSGVELRANFDIFYGSPLALRLGLARGWQQDGGTQLYFVTGTGF